VIINKYILPYIEEEEVLPAIGKETTKIVDKA
jgi:hypothetical protein